MRLERQLIAFGGLVLIGGALLAGGQALAFGQQWRPAQGFGPPTAGRYQRIAKMPGFRPHGAAGPAIERSFGRSQRRSHPPSGFGQRPMQSRPYPQQYAAWRGYPQGLQLPYGPAYYPAQRLMTAGYPGSGWPAPFAGIMPPWGQQMPLFARQFAWRPAVQPWVAHAPLSPRTRYQEPRYRMRAAPVPQTVGFRPTVPRYAPVAGAWRPVVQPVRAVQPQYAYQGYAARPAALSPAPGPMFRSAPGPGYRAPLAVSGRHPVGGAYWRPSGAVAAVQGREGLPFRPQAYGRTPEASKAELVSRDREGLEFTRANLPGWVTTYQDNGYEGSCGWCGGS